MQMWLRETVLGLEIPFRAVDNWTATSVADNRSAVVANTSTRTEEER